MIQSEVGASLAATLNWASRGMLQRVESGQGELG
jgi:hypothetical protein